MLVEQTPLTCWAGGSYAFCFFMTYGQKHLAGHTLIGEVPLAHRTATPLDLLDRWELCVWHKLRRTLTHRGASSPPCSFEQVEPGRRVQADAGKSVSVFSPYLNALLALSLFLFLQL